MKLHDYAPIALILIGLAAVIYSLLVITGVIV